MEFEETEWERKCRLENEVDKILYDFTIKSVEKFYNDKRNIFNNYYLAKDTERNQLIKKLENDFNIEIKTNFLGRFEGINLKN